MSDKITVVLAEDFEVVRKGLRSLLESEEDIVMIGEASNGLDLVRIVEKKNPRIIIMDLVMPDGGIPLIGKMVNDYPETDIIVYSIYDNKSYVIEALEAGAKAYVLKESSFDELLHAIREVTKGRRYLSTKLSQMAIDSFIHHTYEETDLYRTLTPREKQVLKLIAERHSNSQIAQKLAISKRTVEIHRANLMRKLNLRPQYVQLINYASELGIVDKSAAAKNNIL